jgi:hypothetical protein
MDHPCYCTRQISQDFHTLAADQAQSDKSLSHKGKKRVVSLR